MAVAQSETKTPARPQTGDAPVLDVRNLQNLLFYPQRSGFGC